MAAPTMKSLICFWHHNSMSKLSSLNADPTIGYCTPIQFSTIPYIVLKMQQQ